MPLFDASIEGFCRVDAGVKGFCNLCVCEKKLTTHTNCAQCFERVSRSLQGKANGVLIFWIWQIVVKVIE